MAELMAKDEDVITADLVSISPKQPKLPTLVKVEEPETLNRLPATFRAHALVFHFGDGGFPIAVEPHTDRFRGRAASDGRGGRQAGSCSHAATRGRIRQ